MILQNLYKMQYILHSYGIILKNLTENILTQLPNWKRKQMNAVSRSKRNKQKVIERKYGRFTAGTQIEWDFSEAAKRDTMYRCLQPRITLLEDITPDMETVKVSLRFYNQMTREYDTDLTKEDVEVEVSRVFEYNQ
jgi:outer membrane receptor for Fe3+-dicitrate